MYEGMKKAFGPSIIKVSPLKSISGDTITNRGEQMKRLAEHFQELYSKETVVADTTIENINPLPVMEELDAPPSIEELNKSIDSLAWGKAPGSDGIPQKSSRLARSVLSSTISMNSCYSAGRKGQCPKICVMQTSSHFISVPTQAPEDDCILS